MAAEVRYVNGPITADFTGEGYARGDAVMWVQVGKSDQLRPIVLTSAELVRLAFNCLLVLNRRIGE
jgi:hypothetical protein